MSKTSILVHSPYKKTDSSECLVLATNIFYDNVYQSNQQSEIMRDREIQILLRRNSLFVSINLI